MMDYSAQLKDMGLALKAEFIPNPKGDNIKWSVTLCKNDKEVLTTDFSHGIGHLPKIDPSWHGGNSGKYKQYMLKMQSDEMLSTGKQCRLIQQASGYTFKYLGDLEPPSIADVVYCLMIDSEVLNYSSFEDWAESYGYDTDSRKAEKIYDACMKTALKMRNGLGDALMAKISELLQDF